MQVVTAKNRQLKMIQCFEQAELGKDGADGAHGKDGTDGAVAIYYPGDSRHKL